MRGHVGKKASIHGGASPELSGEKGGASILAKEKITNKKTELFLGGEGHPVRYCPRRDLKRDSLSTSKGSILQRECKGEARSAQQRGR